LIAAQVSITFKNQQVLKDVSWDCKKGERVGLVGESPADRVARSATRVDDVL
jgi:ABC-type dipeptide/oligopeptide/nickel transport system ATPase subunit